MKKRILFAIALIFVFLVFAYVKSNYLIKINPQTNKTNSLEISKNIFYRQTYNNCGPYSVMAVINILTGQEKDPEQLAAQTKHRIEDNLTMPQGVIELLHDYKIKTKEFTLKKKTNDQKITWLKNQIDNGTPVIVLIKVKDYLHYITVLGYDENGFMFYDSMQDKRSKNQKMTVIDRAECAGNRYYKNEAFIKMWNEGGYKFFFNNWAVVCSK